MKHALALLVALSAALFAGCVSAQVPARHAPYTAFEWLARGGVNQFGTAPVGMGLPGGTPLPTTPVNLSGWQPAGNFGVNTQVPTGITVGGKADFPLPGGAKAPINVATPITKAAVAASAGMVLKNAARIGLPAVGVFMTVMQIKDYFDQGKVYFDGVNGTQERPVYTISDDSRCSEDPNGATHPYANDAGITAKWMGRYENGMCRYGFLFTSTVYPNMNNYWYGIRSGNPLPEGSKTYLTPEEATALIANAQARADMLQKLIDEDKVHRQKNGINPFGYVAPTIELGSPTITGPATVPGRKSTETESVRLQPGTNVPAAPGQPSDHGIKTTTKEQTTKITYEGDKITTTTITNTVTNITNTVTNITTNEGDKVTEETPDSPPEDPPEEPPTDSPLGDVPKLYERKYPDGLVGIWNEKSEVIKQSSTFTLAAQLMPTGLTAGTCPSWSIALNFASWASFGEHDFAPPCWIWDVAKTIIIISALMLARSLIFGG